MNVARPCRVCESQRGFALFVVLWFLVLLSAIGTYMLTAARSQTALAGNIIAAAKAEDLADAGVSQAVFELTETNTKTQWRADGSQRDLAMPDGTLTIRIFDESTKVNVNLATPALLQGLLQALGTDAGEAKSVAIAIGGWVGTVKTPSQPESWADEYHDAGLRYEPPQAPATSLDELRFVLGMTPSLFARLSPYATVFTTNAAPDPKVASPVIREALAFADAIRPVGNQASPSAAASGAGTPSATAGLAGPSVPSAAVDTLTQDASLVASVDVLAHSREGGVFARHAVIKLDPSNPKGYVVLDWRRVDAD
jgi:general secretion pathway protein K